MPGTEWDTAEALQASASSIDAHISQLRSKKVKQLAPCSITLSANCPSFACLSLLLTWDISHSLILEVNLCIVVHVIVEQGPACTKESACGAIGCSSLDVAFLQVAEVQAKAEKSLSGLIAVPASALFDSCPPDVWPRLGRLLTSSLAKASQVILLP